MKNILKALTVLAAAAALASCGLKEDYVTYSYILLDSSSLRVNEDAGSVSIGLTAHPQGDANINTEVTFEIIDGTAKNGTDFTVSPASGVLSMTGETASITFNIVNDDSYTGDYTFSIKQTDATNGWTLGGSYQATVTITDLNHPLADIAGDYTASGTTYMYGTDTWTATFNTDSEDTSIIWIEGITPDFAGTYSSLGTGYCVCGTVSDDLSTITISTPYFMSQMYYSTYYFAFIIYDGTYYYTSGDYELTYDSSTGTWSSDYGYSIIASSAQNLDDDNVAGFWDLIDPGVTFTKQ